MFTQVTGGLGFLLQRLFSGTAIVEAWKIGLPRAITRIKAIIEAAWGSRTGGVPGMKKKDQITLAALAATCVKILNMIPVEMLVKLASGEIDSMNPMPLKNILARQASVAAKAEAQQEALGVPKVIEAPKETFVTPHATTAAPKETTPIPKETTPTPKEPVTTPKKRGFMRSLSSWFKFGRRPKPVKSESAP